MDYPNNQSFKTVNLLIFEEYVFIRDLLADTFKAFGITNVVTVDNVAEVKKKLEYSILGRPADQFDLLIIDMEPPSNHGLHLLYWLRHHRHTALRYVPVIFTTNDTREEIIRTIRDHGANEILKKPYLIHDVAQYFLRAVNRRRPIVDSTVYVGPDRRLRRDLTYSSQDRRKMKKEDINVVVERAAI